jgi:prolyl-tRNA synthetase
LGQHFSRVFDIQFLDKDKQLKYAWQTSWGVSTRLIGAIIMVHGDDRGLKLPPQIAPVQAVVVPIITKKGRQEVLAKAREVFEGLSDIIRMELDDREEYSAGWKFNEWEMKGVPLRLEIGPRDLAQGGITSVRRDTGEKIFINWEELHQRLPALLDDIQANLFRQARGFMEKNTRLVDSYAEFQEVIQGKKGFVLANWCGDSRCEEEIKNDTKATIRCISFDSGQAGGGPCLFCGNEPAKPVYFARAY